MGWGSYRAGRENVSIMERLETDDHSVALIAASLVAMSSTANTQDVAAGGKKSQVHFSAKDSIGDCASLCCRESCPNECSRAVATPQVGTLVKMVRVMMLGPVVACTAIFARSFRAAQPANAPGKFNVFKVGPWFIVVFFTLAALRSLSLIHDSAISPLQKAANLLTVLSMAARALAWICASSVRSAAGPPQP